MSAARKRGEGTPGGGNGEKNGRKKKRAGRSGEPPPARGVASSIVSSTHLLGQNPEIAALRLLQAPPPSLALHRGAPAVALRRRRRQSVRVRRLSRFDVCRAARRRQQLDASELGVVLLADRASCEMAMGGGGRGALARGVGDGARGGDGERRRERDAADRERAGGGKKRRSRTSKTAAARARSRRERRASARRTREGGVGGVSHAGSRRSRGRRAREPGVATVEAPAARNAGYKRFPRTVAFASRPGEFVVTPASTESARARRGIRFAPSSCADADFL